MRWTKVVGAWMHKNRGEQRDGPGGSGGRLDHGTVAPWHGNQRHVFAAQLGDSQERAEGWRCAA
eukprot:5169354-Amphidinium_carterae.1